MVNHLSRIDGKNDYFLCYRLSRLKKRRYFLKPKNGHFRTKIFHEPFPFLLPGKLDVFHGADCRLPKLPKAKKVVTIHDVFSIISPEFVDERFRKKQNKAVSRGHRTGRSHNHRIVQHAAGPYGEAERSCGENPDHSPGRGLQLPSPAAGRDCRREEALRIEKRTTSSTWGQSAGEKTSPASSRPTPSSGNE